MKGPEMDSESFSRLETAVNSLLKTADRRDTKLTKTAVNKLLYKVAHKLPEDSEHREGLRTFWYKHGCLVDQTHMALRGNDAISKENGYYSLEEDVETDEELERLSDAAMEEYDVMDDDRQRKLYEEEAPYDFMTPFKHGVLEEAKRLSGENKRFRLPWDSSREERIEKLRDLLLDTESRLPMEEEFRDLNELFSRLVGISNVFLDSDPKKREFSMYETVAEELWNAFACRIRLMHHDEKIDPEERGWKKELEEQKITAENYLSMLEETVRSYQDTGKKNGAPGDLWNRLADQITG